MRLTITDEKSGGVTVEPGNIQNILAQNLRVGRQLLTTDGWQDIDGMVVFRDADQVTVFTPQRDDEHTDGWQFHFGDIVQSRMSPTEEQQYQARRRERQERRRLRRLAREAHACPHWCVEHYDGKGDDGRIQRNHSSDPQSVPAADVWTGKEVELGLWLERRDDRETGAVETFGVLEVRLLTSDIELTPANMLLLAAKLQSLAMQAELRR